VNNITSYIDQRSHVSEAYKTIRTNIAFSNIDENVKTILVTSAQPNEGKTTTVSNLAVSFAGLDKKVIVIDCDLRRPSLHKQFNISNLHGLTDALIGSRPYFQCIQKTEIEKLDILTAGQIPPNPSEILSSNNMKTLVKGLSEYYDYVFIDSPPIGSVTDAAIISSYSDGVILVCASNEVDTELAKIAKERLQNVNAKTLGVILNKFDIDTSKYYEYYYYSYGEEDKKSKKRKKK
jgi:capsular exopolysaccharide synthesis family protein